MSVVSWITNALAGGFSAAMLMSEWWAFISIPIAILGAFRRRCSWYTPLKYLGGAVVYAVLFHASLWLNTRLSVPDKLSATLFWWGVLMTCIGGVTFSSAPSNCASRTGAAVFVSRARCAATFSRNPHNGYEKKDPF
jgi:hypothetical protein